MNAALCRTIGRSLFFLMLPVTHIYAAGMIPETSVVVVNEADGEASINLKNSDNRPALLYSQILSIEGDDESLIILTPPVARVEAGETQAIRFLLQTPKPLNVQRLRRVTFEGILPKDKSAGMRVTMNVRQNLPVIIHPKGLAKDNEPWRRLKWSVKNGKLQVVNPDAYVVRLDQAVALLPSNTQLQLPRPHLLPGEIINLDLPAPALAGSTSVTISPATVYGYAVDHYTAPIER